MSDELTPPPGALYEYHALATRLGEMSKTAGSLATSLNDMQFELQDRMMQHLQTDSRMMRTPTELMCSGLTGLTGMSRSVDNDDGGVDKNADVTPNGEMQPSQMFLRVSSGAACEFRGILLRSMPGVLWRRGGTSVRCSLQKVLGGGVVAGDSIDAGDSGGSQRGT